MDCCYRHRQRERLYSFDYKVSSLQFHSGIRTRQAILLTAEILGQKGGVMAQVEVEIRSFGSKYYWYVLTDNIMPYQGRPKVSRAACIKDLKMEKFYRWNCTLVKPGDK